MSNILACPGVITHPIDVDIITVFAHFFVFIQLKRFAALILTPLVIRGKSIHTI